MGTKSLLHKLESLPHALYGRDFLLTAEKSLADLEAIVLVAEILRRLHSENRAARAFDAGLAISIFRDQSTRTRFSFASAANLLGLALQEFDEKKSQVAHGETVRETACMISFLTEAIGIRDDLFIGKGNAYMREVGAALDDAFAHGVLETRPSIVNLQCDIDHPTQSMADLCHLKELFGGSFENLCGKKIAMTWAYSPSYGKPLSVPQGIITLLTRFGMQVALAHPPGYDLLPQTIAEAQKSAAQSGGSFTVGHSLEEAFDGADAVYPKSWAPIAVMEQRSRLFEQGDQKTLAALEREGLEQNARFQEWECDERRMALTRDGRAHYLHCLPADISGVSCAHGEVAVSVFERHRLATYREASHKSFVIAAMILCARFRDPAALLGHFARRSLARRGAL